AAVQRELLAAGRAGGHVLRHALGGAGLLLGQGQQLVRLGVLAHAHSSSPCAALNPNSSPQRSRNPRSASRRRSSTSALNLSPETEAAVLPVAAQICRTGCPRRVRSTTSRRLGLSSATASARSFRQSRRSSPS